MLILKPLRDVVGARFHPVKRGDFHVYITEKFFVMCHRGLRHCVAVTWVSEKRFWNVIAALNVLMPRLATVKAVFDPKFMYFTTLIYPPDADMVRRFEEFVVEVNGGRFILACEKVIDILPYVLA